MPATKPLTLVTSAAGRTGRETVRLLREQGVPVRAFVRQRDSRAAALQLLGAEVFVGNLFDFRDVRQAMNGVSRAYHCPPFAPHLLHNTMLVCLAAQEARIETLVLLSGWNPSPVHPSGLTREHWIANNVARWMPDVGVVHLNPGIFAFTYLLTLPVTRRLGVLPLPYGMGRNAPVAELDIARCAAAILADPVRHHGQSYRPTGPALLSGADAAQAIGLALGRKVRYQPVSTTMFAKAARAQGFPDFDVYNVRHYAAEIAAGAFAIGAPTNHVERLTGRPAEAFEATVTRYAQDVSQIAPNLRDMSLAGALGFMLRMILTPAPDFQRMEKAEGFMPLADPQLGHENADWQSFANRQRLMLLDAHAYSHADANG